LLLIPTVAVAGEGREGRGHAKLDRVCEQIACNEQQREDIARVFTQLRKDIKLDREAIRELRKQMADEWLADEPDERALARLAEKISAHERNIADRQLESMLELHAILSPEQRKQVAAQLMKGDGKRKRQ
jgi:Spy/CpxP family protein refolding chaperone